MADTAFGSAKGAVDSVLGRLTTVLVDEARLLGSVRGEVRFLKDEMESMNGFLLHLAKSTPPGGEHHDDQVRAWMGQVRDLAYSSEICIDMYIQNLGTGGSRGQGLLAYLRRLPQLVLSIPARHKIVTQIRELKARALEIGERRQRYGVTVPTAVTTTQDSLRAVQGYDTVVEENRDARMRALLDMEDAMEDSDFVKADSMKEDDSERLVRLLTKERNGDDVSLRVFPIVGMGGIGKTTVAVSVFRHPSVASFFHYKAWITLGQQKLDPNQFIKDIMAQVISRRSHTDMEEVLSLKQLVEKLKEHLRGKRFLVVLDDIWVMSTWEVVRSLLPDISVHTSCILTTRIMAVAKSSCPNEIIQMEPMADLKAFQSFKNLLHEDHVLDDAVYLLGGKNEMRPLLKFIISIKIRDYDSVRLFLGLLYNNPSWTEEDLQQFANSLDAHEGDEAMFLSCYTDLPYHYKTCLSYLCIFPPDQRVRRTSIIRRWIAENLVTKRDGMSALDEGERCFDELFTRGFLRAVDFSVTDRVKICKMHPLVYEKIEKITREEGTVDTRLVTPSWSYRLSIRKRIQQQQLSKKKDTYFPCFTSRSDKPLDNIISFLEMLPTFSNLSLLKVLDLEGYEGLKEYHIKNICNKMFQLKYLSLRNTGIAQLPKEINKLHFLETLDIRENKVSKFGAKTIMLPMLKHLLAGSRTICPTEDVIKSSETFSTVRMPYGIGAMVNLHILSQIEVSRSDDDLLELGQLYQLKKLGVVIKVSKQKGGKPNFKHLLQAVSKLNKCLRSFSLDIEVPDDDTEIPDLDITTNIFSPPKLLQSLHISGITRGLPTWIYELTGLTKVTLRETSFTHRAIRMLGSLACLSCLKLLYKSYMEIKLSFEKDEFKTLKFLVIEGSHITNIVFASESVTKLEKIVWSFTSMQSLSGTEHLPSLRCIKLNRGQCDLEGLQKLQQEITARSERVFFKLNPPEDGQGSGEANADN